MFSKTLFTAAFVALLATTQVVATAIDPWDACNCPRNCDKELDSLCEYYNDPSERIPIFAGRCVEEAGHLVCRPLTEA